ncbi:MAG: ABC transporter ATP-binding protein [Candidatus Krumholzibacteriia bacterium]
MAATGTPASRGDLNQVRSAMGRGPMRPGRIEKARAPRTALRRLAGYLRPYTATFALVFACVIVFILLGLLEPYLLGVAIDRDIGARAVAPLVRTSVLLLLVFLLDNGFQALSSWLMARVSQDALRRLRLDLFGHLQSLPVPFFDRHTAGELMSRLTNDIEAINQAVSQNVVSLVASTLSMLGIVITMFVLNAWLALAALVVLPLMFGFTEFVARYTRRGFRDLQLQLGHLNGVLEETLSGQRVVTAFGRGEAARARFEQGNQAVCEAGITAISYALSLMPLTNVLGNVFVIVLVGLGGWLAFRDLATIGTITAFIAYGRNFISPLRQLANMYNSIQAALAGAERVFEIMDTGPESDAAAASAPAVTAGDVVFEAVDFAYVPGAPVIRQMSLTARAGQTVALVGPTGAGKTTLVNLLLRFYEVDAGRITIGGRDLREIPRAELRRRLGLVLQDTFLFSDTVLENIRYGRLDATDEEVMAAARLADADQFIRLLPDGYHTRLSERGSNLSQGQRQMLAIARAVLADPAILILDEATSSVDTRTEARIQGALLRLMAGRTSFVIAHRLSTIRDADQVLVIQDGEIVERGTHAELLDRRGVYHELYASQFKGKAI